MTKSSIIVSHARPTTAAENRESVLTGTFNATIAYAPSCMLDCAEQRPPGTWGGARNRIDRTSYCLPRAKVVAMVEAAIFAERIGLAFNRHWTVHYEMAGIADRDGAAFVGRLLANVRRHIRRLGEDTAALWARENGDGKGAHVHILLHVPASATLRNLTQRWIRAAGGVPARRASLVRIIGARGTWARFAGTGEHYRSNADAVLAYLLKAADHRTGRALALQRYDEGGLVIGKRVGWSENIGEAARRRQDVG